MKIFNLSQIKENINISDDLPKLMDSQRSAFIDFSSGLYDVPPPMQFIFPQFKSDCHIKAGYKQGSKNFVIKIINGSYFGSSGVILVFSTNTGKLKAILQDEGFLTTLRTAIAGIIVSELIPWNLHNIGIIGSGDLAAQLYDLIFLKYPKSNIMLYARDKTKAINITDNICDLQILMDKCDVVFTATSAAYPIIHNIQQDKNQAIIALGSDDEYKSEISANIFGKADIIIVDSKLQATKFADISRALQAGIITTNSLLELGEILTLGIAKNAKIIITDFSGIGAQDVAITEFVLSLMI